MHNRWFTYEEFFLGKLKQQIFNYQCRLLGIYTLLSRAFSFVKCTEIAYMGKYAWILWKSKFFISFISLHLLLCQCRQYEERELRVQEERAQKRMEFENQKMRLINQLEFEKSRDTMCKSHLFHTTVWDISP